MSGYTGKTILMVHKSINTKYYLQNADDLGWGLKHPITEYKLTELLSLLTGSRILDVGCGPGSFVHELSTRGFEAVGVDAVPNFITFAKSNYRGRFLVADAVKLPFEDKSFDTVYLRSVLEHLEDDRPALKEALRVGQKVVAIVPRVTPPALLKRGLIFSHYRDLSHVRYYTPDSLKKLCTSLNAALVSIKDTEVLPVPSVVYEMLSGPGLYRRILTKLLFSLCPPAKYYLEIIAIIKP